MDLRYDQKFDEMKKYIPFLDNMIKKLESTTSDVGNPRLAQLNKIRSLRDLLLDKKKRMKMENLLKCEQVLVNLYAKVEQRESLPGIKKPLSRSDDVDQVKLDTVEHMAVKATNPDTLPEIARLSETDSYYSDGNKEPALFHRRPYKVSSNEGNAEPALFHRRPKASPNLTSPNRFQDHALPGPSPRNYTRVLSSPDRNSRRSEGSPSSFKSYNKSLSRSPRKSKYVPPHERKKYKKKVSDQKTSDLNITLNVPEESLDSLNTADILSRIINCDDNDVDIDKLRDLRSQILGELKQTGARDDISDLIMKSYKKKKGDKTKKGKKTEVEEGELSDSESEAIQNIYGSLVVVDDESNKDSLSESKTKSQTDTQQRKIQICLVINPDKDENDHVKKVPAIEIKNKLSHDPSDFEAYDNDTLNKNSNIIPEATSDKQINEKSCSTKTTVDVKANTDNDRKNTEDFSKDIIVPEICKEIEFKDTDNTRSSKNTTEEVSNTINEAKSLLKKGVDANINVNPQPDEETKKKPYVFQPENKNKNRDTGSTPVVNTPENKPLAMINSILFPKKNDSQVLTPSTKELPYRPNFYKPIHEENKIDSNTESASISVKELHQTENLKESGSLKCISTSSNNQKTLTNTNKNNTEVINVTNKELINKCEFDKQESVDTGLTNLSTVVIPLIGQECKPSNTKSDLPKSEPKIVSEIDILRALKNEILNETIPLSSDESGTPALHVPKLTKVASAKEILNKKRISIERYKEKSSTPSKPAMINDLIQGDDIGKKQSLKLTDKECERFNLPVKIPLEVVSSEEEDPETMPSDDIYDLAPKSPDYDVLSDSETSEPVIIPAEPVKLNDVNLHSKGDTDLRKMTPVVHEIAKQLMNIKDASKNSLNNINVNTDSIKNKIPEKTVLVDPRLNKRDLDISQKGTPQPLILNQERTPIGTGMFPNMTPNMTPNARTYEITPSYSAIEPDEPNPRKHVYAPLMSNTNLGARNDRDYRSHSVHKDDSFDDRSRYHHSSRSETYNHRRNSYINDEYEPYNRQDCPSTPNHPFGRSEFSNTHSTKWSDCPPTPSHGYGRQDAPMTPVHPFGRMDVPTTPVHPFGRLDAPTTPIHPFGRQDAPMTPVHHFGRHDAPMTPVHPFGRSDNPTPSSLFDRSECPPTPNHPFGRSDMPRTPSHPFGRSDSSSNHTNRYYNKHDRYDFEHSSSERRRFYPERNDRNLGRGNEYNRYHSESYRLNNREHIIRNEKYKYEYDRHDRYYNENLGYTRDQNRRTDKPLFETDRSSYDRSDRDRQYMQRENSGILQSQREPTAGRHQQFANQRARSVGRTYSEKPTRENTLSFKPDTGKSFTIDTSINRSFQDLFKEDKTNFDNSFNARSQRASSVGRSLVRERNSPTNNKYSEYDSSHLNNRYKFTRALSVGREMCNNKNKNRSEMKADFEAFSRTISTKKDKNFDVTPKTSRKDADESDRSFKDKQQYYQKKEKPATAISTKQMYSPRKNPRDPRLRCSQNSSSTSPSVIDGRKEVENSYERKKHGIVYSSDNIAKGNIMGPGYGVKNYKIPKIKRTVIEVEEKEAKEPIETAKSVEKSEPKVEIKSIASLENKSTNNKNSEAKKGKIIDLKYEKIKPTSQNVTVTSPEKRVTRSATRTDSGKEKLSENEPPPSNKENSLKVNVLEQKSDISNSEMTESTIDKIDEFLNLTSDQDLNEQEESLESSFGIGDLELFSENMVGDPVLENINALIAGLDNDINTKENEKCNEIGNRISIVDDIILNKIPSPEFENLLQKTEELNKNILTNSPSVKVLPSSAANKDSSTSVHRSKISHKIDTIKDNTIVEEEIKAFEKEPDKSCYEESNEIKNNESEDIVSTSNTNICITDQVQKENADSNFGLTPDSTNNSDIIESEKGLPDSTNDTHEMNSDVSSTHEHSLPVPSQKKESELGGIENLLTLLQDNGKIKDLLSKFGSQLNDNKKLKKKLLKLSELISEDEDSDEPTGMNEIDFDESIISEDPAKTDSDKYIPNDIKESFKQNSDNSIQIHEKQSEKIYQDTATKVSLVSDDNQITNAATKKTVDISKIQNVNSLGHESNVVNCTISNATTVNEESSEIKLPTTVNVAIISNSVNSPIEDKKPTNCLDNNTLTNAEIDTTQKEDSPEIRLPATDTVNIEVISNSGKSLIDKVPSNKNHENNIANTITNATIGNTSQNEESPKIKLPATNTVNLEITSNSLSEDKTPANIQDSANLLNNIDPSHNDLTAQGPSQPADNNKNKTSNESQHEASGIKEKSNDKPDEINETNKTNESETERVSITKKAVSTKTISKKKGKSKKVPPKKQKKVKRLTRSAFIKQNDQTKTVKTKKRNELEKLKDDIKEMFLTDDVLNSSGIRMCRLAKLVEETNVSGSKEATEGADPKADAAIEKVIKSGTTEDDSAKKPLKKKSARKSLPAVADVKAQSKSNLPSPKARAKSGPKSKNKDTQNSELSDPYIFESDSIGESSTTKASENSDPSSTDSDDESLATSRSVDSSVELKKKPKRKRKGWQAGVIKPKRKTKKNPNLDSSIDEDEPLFLQRPFEIPDFDCYTDKTYCFLKNKLTYSCRFCEFSGDDIVTHYKKNHPHSEIPLSRMSPSLAREAIEQCEEDNFQAISKMPTDKYVCRFCCKEFGISKRRSNLEVFFWHVVSKHTGEYKQLCSECVNVTRCPFNLDIPPPPKDVGQLIGYICGKCNFTQISLENLKTHVIDRHNDEQTEVFTINLAVMSRRTITGLSKKCKTPKHSRPLRSSRSNPSVTDHSEEQSDITESDTTKYEVPIEFENFNENEPSSSSRIQTKLSFETDDSDVSHKVRSEELLDTIKAEHLDDENEATLSTVDDNRAEGEIVSEVIRATPFKSDSPDVNRHPHFQVKYTSTGSKEYVCCINDSGLHYKTTLLISMKKHVQLKHSEKWDGYCYICKVIVTPLGQYLFKDCLEHYLDKHIDEFPVFYETSQPLEPVEQESNAPTMNSEVQKPIINVRPLCQLLSVDSEVPESELDDAVTNSPSFETETMDTLQHCPAVVQTSQPSPSYPETRKEIAEPKEHRYEEVQAEVMSKKHRVVLDTMMAKNKLIQVFKCAGHYCSFTTDSVEDALMHVSTHQRIGGDNAMNCAYCDFDSSGNFIDLVSHVFKSHGRCQFVCSRCFYRAAASQLVGAHMLRVHGEGPRPGSVLKTTVVTMSEDDNSDLLPRETAVPYYVCKQAHGDAECTFRTYTGGKFGEHLMQNHGNDTTFQCNSCPESAPSAVGLIGHLKQHGYKLYQCTWCVFGADNETQLLAHASSKHYYKPPQAYLRIITNKEGSSDLRVLPLASLNKKKIPFEEVSLNPQNEDPTKEAERASDLEKLIGQTKFMITPQQTTPVQTTAPVPETPIETDALEADALATEMIEADAAQPSGTKTPEPILNTADILTDGSSPEKDRSRSATPLLETEDPTPLEEIPVKVKTEHVEELPTKETLKESEVICLDSDEDEVNEETLNLPQNQPQKRTEAGLPNIKVPLTELLQCPKCQFLGTNIGSFRKHVNRCFPIKDIVVVCKHCSLNIELRHLIVHYKVHCDNPDYRCSICGLTKTSLYTIKRHFKTEHGASTTTISEISPNCYVVSSKTPVNKDIPYVLSNTPVKKDVPNVSSNTPVKRDVPKRKISTSASTSAPPTKLKCYGPLDVDKLPINPIIDEVFCSLCKFSTKVRLNMVRHLQCHEQQQAVPNSAPVNPVPHLESNEKHFDKMVNLAASSGAVDKAKYDSAPVLTSHVPPESLSRFPKYVPARQRHTCGAKGCSYISLDEAMLKCHWETLHSGPTEYLCVHCPSSQQVDTSKPLTAKRIIGHLKMHDVRLYACSSCSYYHHKRPIVEKHITASHGANKAKVMVVREEVAQQPTTPVVQSTSTAPTMDLKPWQCGLCKFKSMLRAEVVDHCFKFHQSKMQFKCSYCPFRTSAIENVTKHQAASHANKQEAVFYYYYHEGSIPDEADGTPRWVKQRNESGLGETQVKTEVGESTSKLTTATDPNPVLAPTTPIAAARVEIDLDIVKSEIDEDEEEGSTEDLCLTFGPLGEPNGLLFKCPLCKTLTDACKETMQSHLYEELKYRKWGCNNCTYKAFHRKGLDEHMMTEHRQCRSVPIELPIDKKVEQWVSKVLLHQEVLIAINKENFAKQKIQNPIPSTSVPQKQTQKEAHGQTFSTEVLEKAFGTLGAPVDMDYCCPKCLMRITDEQEMQNHLESELSKIRWSCSSCSKTFQNYHEAEFHCRSQCPRSRPVVPASLRDPDLRAAWVTAVVTSQRLAINHPAATAQQPADDNTNSLLAIRYEEPVQTPEGSASRKRPASDSDDDKLEINEEDYDDLTFEPSSSRRKVAAVAAMQCPYCSFEGMYANSMKVHRLRHFKLKAHACAYCHFDAGQKQIVQKHQKTKHPELQENVLKIEEPLGPPLVIDLKKTPTIRTCLVCFMNVNVKYDSVHSHTGIYSGFVQDDSLVIKCSICSIMFENDHYFKLHQKAQHPNVPPSFTLVKFEGGSFAMSLQ